MVYRGAAATCPGKKKSYNSNNFYLNSRYITEDYSASQVVLAHKKDQKGLQMYAVCEGYGADVYNNEASLIAVKNMLKFHTKKLEELSAMREEGKSTSGMNIVNFVNAYIQSTNNAVKSKAESLGEQGFGIQSTLGLVCIKGRRVVTANLGDTRIYHFRNGKLRQISDNHTQAQKMVSLNILSPERAASHPKRHRLTQYFGIRSEENPLEPSVYEMTAEDKDMFIICSRAFFENIDETDMAAIIGQCETPSEIIDKLMSEIAESGFSEDTTLVAVQAIDNNPQPAPVPEAAAAAIDAAAAAADSEIPAAVSAEETAEAASAVQKTAEAAAAEIPAAVSEIRKARPAEAEATEIEIPLNGNSKPVSETSEGADASPIVEEESARKTAVIIHEEEPQPADSSEEMRGTEKSSDKPAGLLAKLKDFLGIDASSSDSSMWPALIVVILCIIIIILFLVLGIKYYKNSKTVDNPGVPVSTASNDPGEENPTDEPETTEAPTDEPEITVEPTGEPTEEPTDEPTSEPTDEPTKKPTERPTEKPTERPTQKPTERPTERPTEIPTERPTTGPETGEPTTGPETGEPTTEPETGEPATEPETGEPTTEPETGEPATEPETGEPAQETEE